ncbi:MAG TPA: aspartate carbamoyltransferase [Candidatus Peribacter riflensis]|uniref:Aspartate carbamoyltransferase n=1 Tax=Candidatus Peribacter riflensis TaxID=1735162 RepID=A0A0S1SNG2_9BACT|nr:MAG: aspartate carbamoyltransferase catalytic subunit [Candidatus Peribacter riflensis]OGJ78435.1 MAG: aspartate carbamoyltransferase [Candidatus Peribacteria bacterium RIFOXYB1_FULL_57_12]OGJ79931.1 MAG: aspartate carbamoyltransferase [Candidatus Peribacteria bacterium RIFOXYC1_FULL_58_8]ALM11483.1 MAG: aspartate carbamoyltransferase catalytic subunit [Candidatus Peribacter riflensis]ALM12585.1 MAG: aspartate carbamoyltransferase catalytic subunit [Candidatus Peribacter riflensis]
MPLPFRHLTSTKQFSRSDTDAVLQVAEKMEKVLAKGGSDLLAGKILAALFYEPSTRTRLSFETAMQRLGGNVITADGLQFSSMYKGETVEDTMMVVGQYADLIVMRHPEQGSADRAASVSPVPFINAGDGPGQHPTQALLDLYTIQKERGTLDGIHIAMVGDLKFGRTVHSLSFLLGLYRDIRFTLIAPKELVMPPKVTSFLKEKGIFYTETENMEQGLDADVLYMTRVQKERFEKPEEYERLKLKYILRPEQVSGRSVTVLHPLPRVGEITPDVDALPNAAYFRQVRNGVVVRMALLAMLLQKA